MTLNIFTTVSGRTLSAILIAATMWNTFAPPTWARDSRRLVSDAQARHLGLERAWFAQVRLDPARNDVERAVLEGDRLTVLTTAGVVHEFDALTGRTMWTAPIGNPDHPSLGPAASTKYVAVVSGSTLFVLDKADGKPVVIRSVGGAPGAAPAVAENYVFVPLAMGRIEAYPLGEQKLTPWYYQSFGRAMVAPLATPESFVWTTDSGHFYVGRSGELGVRFRLETGSEIMAPPAYGAPNVYAATANGEVFSMNEMTGERNWKYAAGFPVMRAPAVVGGKVFVTSDEPMLHCIDAKTGDGLWEAPHVKQFAAASAKRVYGVDELGALVVLDASNGTLLGRMPTDASTNALVNDQTDRVYLVSKEGVVQCFREIGSKAPVYHRPKVDPAATPAAEGQPDAADGSVPPAVPSRPPAAEEVAEEDAAPADEMDEAPAAEDAGMEEDPFDVLENE
jgi:outer membrane protein assembly factor BamB